MCHMVLHCSVGNQVFWEGLSRELDTSQTMLDGLFPCLQDLLDIHFTFLDRLVCMQNLTADKSIDSVGTLLVGQVPAVLSRS